MDPIERSIVEARNEIRETGHRHLMLGNMIFAFLVTIFMSIAFIVNGSLSFIDGIIYLIPMTISLGISFLIMYYIIYLFVVMVSWFAQLKGTTQILLIILTGFLFLILLIVGMMFAMFLLPYGILCTRYSVSIFELNKEKVIKYSIITAIVALIFSIFMLLSI